MAFLNDADKQRLRKAIEAAESRTSGEFVTVIAHAADDYLYIPVLWAALVALLIPGLLQWFAPAAWLEHTYTIQVIGFVVIAILFRLPAIKMRLIPAAVKRQRAHRVALEQFMLQGLHGTQERNGVLLFVSVAEHYVEILADKGVDERVEAGTWDTLVSEFVANVRANRIAEGFVQTVEACGRILEEHFPWREGDRNELPDHLIEI